MLYIYDAVVIGAGPAGLAAGMVLKDNGMQYLILEKGKDLIERDVRTPGDISSGVGGCGLFSDGKLSFAPSASNLWTKLRKQELEKSYEDLWKVMNQFGINLLLWEDEWTVLSKKGESSLKKYHSIVMNNFVRIRLLNFFYEKNYENIVYKCQVTTIEKAGGYYEIKTDTGQVYCTRNIIIATGRFGNEILKQNAISSGCTWMDKLEMGIRVETPTSNFKPYKEETVDYKLIKKEKNIEFRTFCSCKNGTVVQTEFDNYISFNGAQTQFPTQKSNIGLLIRSTDENSEYEKEMKEYLKVYHDPVRLLLCDFLKADRIIIGEKMDKILREKIHYIMELDESVEKESVVYGPEIEYVGEYIRIKNTDLKVKKHIYIAGDVSGSFRGLMAALVSGIYCANDIINQVMQNVRASVSRLGIKASNIDSMRLVFTAQSKNYFYCKDVICQYVLNQNRLPINPFMVFGYFLGDRVERDIIRRGNNQLIQMCEELWVFGPIADGVLFEIALAKQTGKSIRYFKLGSKINEIKEIKDMSDIVFEPEVHSKQIKKSELMAFIQNQNIDDGQFNLFDMFIRDEDDGF